MHSDFWRHEVPYLSPRYRVITFDDLGNGASDRSTEPEAYSDLLLAEDAAAVLDANDTRTAAVARVSQGGA